MENNVKLVQVGMSQYLDSKQAGVGDTVLLFYDSLRSGPVGSRLLGGLYQGLNDKSLELIGAGPWTGPVP